MQNEIYYYYNIYPDNIYKENNRYEITHNKDIYYLYPVDITLNDTVMINNILKENNLNIFEFVTNKKYELVSNIKNANYTLIKLLISKNTTKKANLNDIIALSSINKLNNKMPVKWIELWENKLDNLSLSEKEIIGDNKDIYNTFNYYLGYGEMALNYLKYSVSNNTNYYLGLVHIRLNNISYIDFYNPFNIIIDIRVRDICEYIKIKYLNDDSYQILLNNFINILNLTYDELIILISRLIFPTNYFDFIENNDKEMLKKIIIHSNDYKSFINNCFSIVLTKVEIPLIDCLEH